MRRETQFLKVFHNHTMLTTPPTFGISLDVLDLNSSLLVGTRKTQPLPQWYKTQLNGRELNSLFQWQKLNCLPAWSNLKSSTEWCGFNFNTVVGPQLLNTMVGHQLLNTMVGPLLNLFLKSSKFSVHLFWA